MKKEMKDTSFYFYEGLRSPMEKKKERVDSEVSKKNNLQLEDNLEIEELHYEMVKMNQNVRRLQQET